MNVKPVTLAGEHVRLEPFSTEHASDLWAVGGNHPELFQYLPFPVTSEEHIAEFVKVAIGLAQSGAGVGFVQTSVADNEEWPTVKKKLLGFMESKKSQP